VAAVAAFVQSTTGFGFALILSPVLFAISEPAEAVFALLVLGIALNLLVLGERRPIEAARADVVGIVAAATPGVAVGLLILSVLAKPTLQVTVGVVVMAGGALQLLAERRSPDAPLAAHRTVYPAGFAAGVLTTSTSVSGPPLVLWLMRRRASPGRVRDTLAASFLALNILGTVGLAIAGSLAAAPDVLSLLVLLPATALGQVAGRLGFRRLEERRFRAAALALVVIAGAVSVGAGLGAV
jgi:uncharacterized membrane protein YfcA